MTPPAASTEPAFHALSDRALWHQRAFWAANAGLDTAARAFLTACNREMTRRGLDAGIAPPPPAGAPELRAALAALLDRAAPVHIGSDHVQVTFPRARLHDLQALALDPGEPALGLDPRDA